MGIVAVSKAIGAIRTLCSIPHSIARRVTKAGCQEFPNFVRLMTCIVIEAQRRVVTNKKRSVVSPPRRMPWRDPIHELCCLTVTFSPCIQLVRNSGPCRLQRYDEGVVHTLLNSLRPEPPAGSSLSRPRVTVTAKDFEEAATEREKWFNVPYQAGFSYFCSLWLSLLLLRVCLSWPSLVLCSRLS